VRVYERRIIIIIINLDYLPYLLALCRIIIIVGHLLPLAPMSIPM